MKRPVDQAKLLFFGLLRSVSSLEHQHPPKKIIPYFHHGAAAMMNGRNGGNLKNGSSSFLGGRLLQSGISTTSTACGSSSSSAATSATTTTTMTMGGGSGGGIFSIYGARRGGGGSGGAASRSSNTNDNIGQAPPQSINYQDDRIMSRFRRPRSLVNNDNENNNNNMSNNHVNNGKNVLPSSLVGTNNVKITLRLAKRTDICGIQQCNLATLPENYNQQFYMNHLRTWPGLAIVAEAVCCSSPSSFEHDEPDSAALSSSSSASSSSNGSSNPRPLAYSPFSTNQYNNNYNNNNGNKFSEPTIVAYVIGKVEERTVFLDQEAQFLRMQQDSDENGYYSSVFQKRSHPRQQQHQQPPPVPQYTIERFGHVTSLAVLEPFRRLGLARDLMKQLHHHMAACYTATSESNNNNNNNNNSGGVASGSGSGGVESVGLHVRQSNLAAASLYQNFGYEITQRIPHYYQDGEDAYLMTKRLSVDAHIQQQQQQQQQQRHVGSGVRGNSAVASLFPSSVFGSFRSPPRPWDKNFGVPLELQLPRVIHCTNSNTDSDNVYDGSNSLRRNELHQPSQQGRDDLVDYTSSSTSTSTTPELLTGTM